MDRAHVELRQDEPGERLRFECVDKPVMSVTTRLGCLTIVLVVFGAVEAALYFSEDSLPFILFTIVAAVIALPVAVLTALRFHRTLSFDLNRHEGTLRYQVGHPEKPPAQAGAIELSEIDHVFLAVAKAEDNVRDLPFRLRVHGSRPGPSLFEGTLVVAGIDDEAEITELFMKMARVIGLGHYRVLVRDPKRYELRLTRHAEDRSEPVGSRSRERVHDAS